MLFFRLAICCTYYQCTLNMLFRAVLESKPHWVRMLLCCLCSKRLWLTKHRCAQRLARGGASHISVDVAVVNNLHALPTFWARRPCRHRFQCGLVHTQQRPCRDFAMWPLNGGPFGCQTCPLLSSHDAPVAPFLSPVCCRFDCLAISPAIFLVRV